METGRLLRELELAEVFNDSEEKSTLDASGRRIYTIGHLASRLHSLVHLDLSNNCIWSLKGLERCALLSTLGLSGNYLATTSSLQPLQALAKLENLNLKGNPIAESPLYRPYVVYYMESLMDLDGL